MFRRQLAVASVITRIFERNRLFKPILVGGCVVSLYTSEMYKTIDLDMKSEQVDAYTHILIELGYKKQGKDFYHPQLDSYIEFPSGRMEDSMEHVREFIVDETRLPIYTVGFEDLILDRIHSFVATNDQGSKEWALRMMGVLYPSIDWSYLHHRARQLNILKETEKIQRTVKRYAQIYKLMQENE
jgi:hypothetical protein